MRCGASYYRSALHWCRFSKTPNETPRHLTGMGDPSEAFGHAGHNARGLWGMKYTYDIRIMEH